MLYLFVRERLQWNLSTFGFFYIYNWIMAAAGEFILQIANSNHYKF